MKINWKVRFKNKVWLLTFIGAIVGVIYTLLAMFGVVPKVDQEQVMDLVKLLLSILVTIGVIVDPTTEGTNDSDRAMTYGRFDEHEVESMGAGGEDDEL